MKKIPTLFERDWLGDRSRVLPRVTPGCEWVVAGEGRALQKLDGTCCLVRDGALWKRQEIKGTPVYEYEGGPAVAVNVETFESSFSGGFVPIGWDVTPGRRGDIGKVVGWLRVGDGPEDRWHREAWQRLVERAGASIEEGTYELLGPKVQGNSELQTEHVLIRHASIREWPNAPRTFDGLAAWFASRPGLGGIEGLVFHHPDGRMAKIKGRDFGIRRSLPDEA